MFDEEGANVDCITEEYLKKLKELADAAEKDARAAEKAKGEAEKARDDTCNASVVITDIKNRLVHFVQVLPAYEYATEGEIYAVLKNQDGNLFDLWSPQNGEWRYLGSERILANGMKQYKLTLSTDGWAEKKQSLTISDFGEGWTVDSVIPADESVMLYLLDGIRLESADGGIVVFTCDTVPTENVKIIVSVKVEYMLPPLSWNGECVNLVEGENIEIKDNVISVKTTNDAQQDNTRPITSSGVYTIVGNIDILLKII